MPTCFVHISYICLLVLFTFLFKVVTLATYAYFVACLFGRQYLLPTQYKVEGDTYVPVRLEKNQDWLKNTKEQS